MAEIIENRKAGAINHANQETTMMFWEIGQYINSIVLGNKRAEYGKKILSTLSIKLTERYGKSFAEQNPYRMMLFAERFADPRIVATLSPQLSRPHINA